MNVWWVGRGGVRELGKELIEEFGLGVRGLVADVVDCGSGRGVMFVEEVEMRCVIRSGTLCGVTFSTTVNEGRSSTVVGAVPSG